MAHPRLQTLSGAAATGSAEPEADTTCPLCIASFAMVNNCHDGCPMSNGCSLVRCPDCGFEFPDPERSFFATLIKKWFAAKPKPPLGESL